MENKKKLEKFTIGRKNRDEEQGQEENAGNFKTPTRRRPMYQSPPPRQRHFNRAIFAFISKSQVPNARDVFHDFQEVQQNGLPPKKPAINYSPQDPKDTPHFSALPYNIIDDYIILTLEQEFQNDFDLLASLLHRPVEGLVRRSQRLNTITPGQRLEIKWRALTQLEDAKNWQAILHRRQFSIEKMEENSGYFLDIRLMEFKALHTFFSKLNKDFFHYTDSPIAKYRPEKKKCPPNFESRCEKKVKMTQKMVNSSDNRLIAIKISQYLLNRESAELEKLMRSICSDNQIDYSDFRALIVDHLGKFGLRDLENYIRVGKLMYKKSNKN
jgi:hypothetical protein